jgi:hypothetical protein
MLRRWALACGAILLLSGCVTGSGTDFTSLAQQVGPPKSGQSRIVVLQEKREGLSLSICACEIKLDGDAIGKAKPGTYVYADRPAGRHWLIASELLFPGDSKREIRTESGRTYFFLVRASKRHDALMGTTIVGGLAGMAVGSIATAGIENPGPADIFPLGDAAARTTLADLQLSD